MGDQLVRSEETEQQQYTNSLCIDSVFHSARAFSDTFLLGTTLDLSFFFYATRPLGLMTPEVFPVWTFWGFYYPNKTAGM